eukprot:TRINITY_DN7730_c0_g2_i1.p3 TRINITY_DN7730_c0_g2~~TRINITY_DN7730_c0_g2_i1.p3  ORF type:complete len:156 (+),score=40.05 TRINITY_DN7730_c0_g2_i1:1207-1674(+)
MVFSSAGCPVDKTSNVGAVITLSDTGALMAATAHQLGSAAVFELTAANAVAARISGVGSVTTTVTQAQVQELLAGRGSVTIKSADCTLTATPQVLVCPFQPVWAVLTNTSVVAPYTAMPGFAVTAGFKVGQQLRVQTTVRITLKRLTMHSNSTRW